MYVIYPTCKDYQTEKNQDTSVVLFIRLIVESMHKLEISLLHVHFFFSEFKIDEPGLIRKSMY